MKNSHYLGKLCKREHDYNGTGQSLRYVKNHGTCIECKREQSNKWKIDHPEEMKKLQKDWYNANKIHHANWKQSYRKKHPLKNLLTRFGTRHRKKNYPNNCDLTIEFLEELWVKQNGKCYWLNIEMRFNVSSYSPLKATLDRLDSTQGYTRNNVVWATGFANRGRNTASVDEFKNVLSILGIKNSKCFMEHA